MFKGSKVALLAATLTAAAAMPASAQSWKWDWNVNGGYSKYSNMLKDEALTNADNTDVKFSNGGLVGSQLTFWFAKSIGLRFNGTYADRPVTSDSYSIITPANSGLNHVNLWSGSADLMFRLAQPKDEFSGMEVLPYVAAGVGAKWHNPAGDNYTCSDATDNKSWNCAPFSVGGSGITTNNLALSEANTIMGLAGLGADWRVSRNIAIRTEIGDRIYKPQISALTTTPAITISTTPATFALSNGDTRVSKTVHELYGQIGLGFLFGVARPTAVAVVEPAPAPVTPAPAPTVSRESMNVCVVDPTAEGGLRMQAVTLVGGRDTVVVVGGQDRPFAGSLGNVSVAGNSDWYVRGQPLTFTVNGTNWSYVTYGSPRMINNTDLAFVGTVNGMPVYADRNDVASFQTELYQVNRNGDLTTVLGSQKTLATNLGKVKVFYVPTQASGCVFQAVQRQEEVRKGK